VQATVLATVLRHDGRQLTDTSRLVSAVEVAAALDDTAGQDVGEDPSDAVAAVAAHLAAGSSADVTAELDTLGIGAVLVPYGTDAERGDLAGRLDATPGLERVTATAVGTIWRSSGLGAGTAAWARVVVGGADDGAGGANGAVEAVLPAGPDGTLDVTVEPGAGGRLLVLAERADAGWRATLDGRSLRAVESGWRQAFELGADGGRLVVVHEPATRTPWLALAGVLLGTTVLLALPVRRRRG